MTPEELSSVGGRDCEASFLRNRTIPPQLLFRARELRKSQTSAEQILWECLRSRGLCNAKFRRQHNINRFIADFYCHAAALVIEVDGKIHDERKDIDAVRDRFFQSQGLTVLRFTNDEIFDGLGAVLQQIAHHVAAAPQ